jgi:hypothetical protein
VYSHLNSIVHWQYKMTDECTVICIAWTLWNLMKATAHPCWKLHFFPFKNKNKEYNCSTVLTAVDTQYITIYSSCKNCVHTSILTGQYDKRDCTSTSTCTHTWWYFKTFCTYKQAIKYKLMQIYVHNRIFL